MVENIILFTKSRMKTQIRYAFKMLMLYPGLTRKALTSAVLDRIADKWDDTAIGLFILTAQI